MCMCIAWRDWRYPTVANADSLTRALVQLDAWLETMRQPGGYGGPVAHWWHDQFLYTGPGLDWRYEGILIGYSELWKKTGNRQWLQRVQQATEDLKLGQTAAGSFAMSGFERNPETLGTPHEAAASLGLLQSMQVTGDRTALPTARRNLAHLVQKLWDPVARGFNDRPGTPGRVPNKLATLSQALCLLAQLTNDSHWLDWAKAAIDDVVRFQIPQGPFQGAIHQYAPDNQHGDGRLFPFYNARCVEPLGVASHVFNDPRYLAAAHEVLKFLRYTMTSDGQWPQICYLSGQSAAYPRWIAGSAEILYAFHTLGEPLPTGPLDQLLTSQLPSGGFPTAIGFARKTRRRAPLDPPDYRDVTPVTGWNDKVLRLLSALLPPSADVWPEPAITTYSREVLMHRKPIIFTETFDHFYYGDHLSMRKAEPWAKGRLIWG